MTELNVAKVTSFLSGPLSWFRSRPGREPSAHHSSSSSKLSFVAVNAPDSLLDHLTPNTRSPNSTLSLPSDSVERELTLSSSSSCTGERRPRRWLNKRIGGWVSDSSSSLRGHDFEKMRNMRS